MPNVKRINISLQSDTLDRLDQYAFEEHVSRSQAITSLVWKAHVKNTNVRGQMNIDDFVKTVKSSKPR
jgi:metal-responsive CopG/Arc/MetJ family transcriptional regulator